MTEMRVPYSGRNERRFCQGQAEVPAEREEWEMANKDIFRTTVFGGYQKEDVMDYVRSLENEKETVKILASKENAGIKTELEQEKKANEELKNALLSCKEQLGRLEAERKKTKEEQEQIRLQLMEERSNLQKKQSTWAESLTRMQEDLKSQEEEWRQRTEKFLELEKARRGQEQAVTHLREQVRQEQEQQKVLKDELASLKDQESRLQEELARSLAENERLQGEASGWMQEKESLFSEKEKLEAECRRLRDSVRDGETKLRRLQDVQRQAERLKKSNHELMERCRRLEADHRIVKGNGEARKSGLNGVLEKLVPAARAAKQERKAGIPFSPEASAPEPMPELSAGFMGMEESASMEEPVPAPSHIEETTARTFPEADASDTLDTKSLDTQLPKEEPAVITDEPEPGYPEEDDMESAQELYRRHAENVNRSIITAQERIARLLEELQLDTASDEKTPGQTAPEQ